MYSIAAAACANGLNVEEYLTELFRTPAGTVLLPWYNRQRRMTMILERKDTDLFYSLWFLLLGFVNSRYPVSPGIGAIEFGKSIDMRDAKAIADYVWEHTEVIDEYLAEADLSEEHREIVAGWKRCRPGKYILERHLKKGSVFISADDGTVYMVLGLYSTWEEMLCGRPLPVLLNAVLLPFRDKIITDGLVIPYNVDFGRGAAADFKDIYMDAKKSGRIRFSL